jgi:hypothetical protein
LFSPPLFLGLFLAQPLRAELDLDRAPVDVEKEEAAKIGTKDKSKSPPHNNLQSQKYRPPSKSYLLRPSAIRGHRECGNERDTVAAEAEVGAATHSGKASGVPPKESLSPAARSGACVVAGAGHGSAPAS